ncbi:MAG: hypothetical protein Q8L60_09115 [Gammaproteobacteria bacterium]|nr:hypothetical protein [Gammaproteobacteria bacterium]MDP2347359.1 hypothetical protein [Gammaproteobacteria bacterium]
MTSPTNRSAFETALFSATMLLIPPIVRNSLIEDADFRAEYGLKTSALVNFGTSGLSIDLEAFVKSVKDLLNGVSCTEIESASGEKLVLEKGEGGKNIILFTANRERAINLPDFYQFSPVRKNRLAGLRRDIKESAFPKVDAKKWKEIIAERPLEFEEYEIFSRDFVNTPVRMAEQIRSNILSGKSQVSDLVPKSEIYYQRLIGSFDQSKNIQEFSSNVVCVRFAELKSWNRSKGLSYSLMVASHRLISSYIDINDLKFSELSNLMKYLEDNGDPVSLIGGIECGIRALSAHPELEEHVINLVRILLEDDLNETSKGIHLYSSIVILVDGELSRLKVFADAPPFYRRLASLTHAALVHRQLMHLNLGVDQFHKWVLESHGVNFYAQSFADMRQEPRWSPDMLSPEQVKAYLLGRILVAAESSREVLERTKIHNIIFGDQPESVQMQITFPKSYMPGPLEGDADATPEMPVEFVELIEKQLYSEETGPSSFFALLNFALIFKIDSNYAQHTAEILKEKQYHLNNVENVQQLISILSRLATLAAVTRSTKLADELLLLLRAYRRDKEYKLSIDEYIHIGLEAAASRSERKEWCVYVGNLFQQLAFSELSCDEAKSAVYYMGSLCRCVPQLWRTCSIADAAFQAYVGIEPH